MRIIICTAQVPFVRGGAELLVEGLRDALRSRGHVVDIVSLPYRWQPHQHLLDSILAWRMIDLNEVDGVPVDLVIATKFPSYYVNHKRKVIWLVHQHRQAYDWYGGSFSDFVNSAEDREIRDAIIQADSAAFAEAHGLFAISANVAQRAKRYNYAQAQPLYPPSAYAEHLRHETYGTYILSDARLDAAKRLDLLVRAAALMQVPFRIVLTSTGPERDALTALVAQLGLTDRVELKGFVSTAELMDLYAHARAVYYAPIDEDYGFTTVQAMRASKAVVTCSDSGGTLEFVRDGHNGIVCPPDPVGIAQALDRLARDVTYAANLGGQGPASVAHVTWDRVIDALLGETTGAEQRCRTDK
jgi:glycosyltransferase involved in cell wall biosynthesis